jgi:hypothetical protein
LSFMSNGKNSPRSAAPPYVIPGHNKTQKRGHGTYILHLILAMFCGGMIQEIGCECCVDSYLILFLFIFTIQDTNQRSISHIASSVYIVLKSQEQKSPSLMSLRELLDTVGTTVFDFFRETTLILQTAAKEQWFQALFDGPDCVSSLEKDFKQMEANFIILVILHTKFLKV